MSHRPQIGHIGHGKANGYEKHTVKTKAAVGAEGLELDMGGEDKLDDAFARF